MQIKSGELSHADVIEEMINNGLLPVDVTEIGKIPISVGTIGRKNPSAEIFPRLRAPVNFTSVNFTSVNFTSVNFTRLQKQKDSHLIANTSICE
jgi:uncharacterized protein YjbI with pentapeptide repeats